MNDNTLPTYGIPRLDSFWKNIMLEKVNSNKIFKKLKIDNKKK